MKALILNIQGTGSVSHAKITLTTNTAAYCRQEARKDKNNEGKKYPIRLTSQ